MGAAWARNAMCESTLGGTAVSVARLQQVSPVSSVQNNFSDNFKSFINKTAMYCLNT